MKDSLQLLQVVHTALSDGGLDVEAIYGRLGYNLEKLSVRGDRTPQAQHAAFWEAVETVTGDVDIGLHLCPHLPPFRGEVLDYIFFSSNTFRDGIRRALKYLRLVSDALEITIGETGDIARASIRYQGDDAETPRHTEILVTYGVIQFARRFAGAELMPRSVTLRCTALSPIADYEKIFGCPVTLGMPHTTVQFDRAVLDQASPHSDPELLSLHEELAEKRLSNLERQDLIDRIRALFAQKLEIEAFELDDIAGQLGIAPRRLRFELARAGTSFSDLLAEFRYSLARRLLGKTDERIENIVYLTGFSEPSTFYRAFKRWSGMTPVQYREQKRGQLAAAVAGDR
jgi:AraC-like DNA-binding protein